MALGAARKPCALLRMMAARQGQKITSRDMAALQFAVKTSEELPALTKVIDKLIAVLDSTERVQRVNAMNALRDELDVVADVARGPGGAAT